MKTLNAILISIFTCSLISLKAQYSPIWTNLEVGGTFLALENTDSDPQKEFLFENSGRLYIVDGQSGIIEYNSGETWSNIELEKILDYDGDGVYEILFKGFDNGPGYEWILLGKEGISVNEIFINKLQSSNFPNPFKQTTTIKYSVPKNNTLVNVKIFDSNGNELKIIVNEIKNSGEYEILFNGVDLSSGMYFYQINIGNEIGTKKMIKTE